MKKHIFAGIGIAGALMFSLAIVAQPTSAQTAGEIQSQIQELLARVAELREQLARITNQNISEAKPDTKPEISTISRHRVCHILSRNLSRGVSGDDVTGLQEFLSEEGYFTANATGYFGPLTGQALARWQAAQGVDAVGVAGPMTRERIKAWCGNLGGNVQRFGATPQRGEAPLTVTFSTWISGFRVPSIHYTIDFGDGSSERAANCLAPADACVSPGQNTHTYTQNGTYTATLNKITDPCAGQTACRAAVHTEVVGKTQIHIGTPVACTKEYIPVCGAKPIVCITTPCNPIPTTYGNRCTMSADRATFLYEGVCRNEPACTMEAKICPDGSAVGRTGPHCEFASCPSF